MSGAEAILVLGVISSIISIVDATKQIYDAATNAQSLPEAFRDVAGRLPIVRNILAAVKEHLDQGDIDEDLCKGTKHVIEACEKKAKRLDELFHKAIPTSGASDLQRYYKAVKAYGKGNTVESLMKGMLEDLQLLACDQGMKTATKAEQEEIAQAITELAAVSPSVPESLFQETSVTANNSSSGTQNIAQGEYIAQGQARQYISGGGPMNFDVRIESSMPRPSDAKVISQSLPPATPAFFGREREMEVVQDFLLSKDIGQKLAVLTGIGGLGKTQIALQFWSKQANSYRSRVWIDATSLATVLSSFREIALAVGGNVALGCNETTSRQPMIAVKSWLALTDNTEWLLVLDNVEDLDCDYTLQDLIPKCNHGAILVTTTQSETARILGALNVEVERIEKDAGAAILRQKFKRKSCTHEEKILIDHIIEALHGVPLAIEQASAYLQFNPSLTTRVLKGFLAKLSSPNARADILAKIPKKSMWFYEKHRSVIDTFSLLKTSLAQNNDDALNILLISAFLAQGEIPLSFLTQPVTGGDESSTVAKVRATCDELRESPPEPLAWLRRITADETTYYMALEILEQFCCIKRRLAPDNSTYLGYSMHNVIRHWCQETLDSEKQAEWTVMAAFQLGRYLQVDKVSIFSHQNYSRHVGHVNKVLLDPQYSYLVRHPDGIYWWQAFVTACVWVRFYRRQRRFDLARRMVEVIILYEQSTYDSQWPSQRESLETLHLQATILWEEGDFSNASQCYKDLLQACETHLGHFDDLTVEALQGLRNVQDRSKQHLRQLHMAACIVEPDSLPYRNKEYISSNEESISSNGENLGLRQFLRRYAEPISVTSSFYEAASRGDTVEVQLMLNDGVDIEARYSSSKTALISAACEGYEATVRLLLKSGANIEAKDMVGRTALLGVVWGGHKTVVQQLLKMGVGVEAANENLLIALMEAASGAREAVIELLLEKGVNTEAKDVDGLTALTWAAYEGYGATLQLLLEKGANIEAQDRFGMTALMLAARQGQKAVVQKLLEKGANIEAKGVNGLTALIFAAGQGHKAIVQQLLEKGAIIEANDIEGRTALDFAAQNGCEDIVQLLKEWGTLRRRIRRRDNVN